MIESLFGIGSSLGILVVSLAVLLYCADKLVQGSEELGLYLGVPPFLMGLTVLAIGTSLPELVTGIFAVVDGNGELVMGTVLGSNIANILLILGFASFYAREIDINWDLLHGDLPVLFGSVLLLGFFIYPVSSSDAQLYDQVTQAMAGKGDDALANRAVVHMVEAGFLIAGYLLYLYYYTLKNPNSEDLLDIPAEDRGKLRWQAGFWIVFGLVGVPLGANFTVDAAVDIATSLGVAKGVVAASLISVGTSLPELAVSLSAIKHKNYEMALGNVTGSNIFNTFVVLGVPALIAPFVGNKTSLGVGEPSILFLQFPYYLATIIIFLVIVLDKKLTRTEGLLILMAYAVFFSKLYSFF